MTIALVLGLVFGPLAGWAAFLITYQEYRRHFPDRRPALRAALETGLVAFVFFLALSVLAGFVMERIAGELGG